MVKISRSVAKNNPWIWITWEKHRRTRELCKDFGITLFELYIHLPRLFRYPYLLVWTVYVILQMKPKGIIIQNPSIVLALWTIFLKGFLRFRLTIDSHNEGLYPFYKWLNFLMFIYRYIQKMADITIVTNENLARIVRESGGNPFVLEDKLPEFTQFIKISLKGRYNIACISTFAKDEPFHEVIEAARLLDEDIFIYITGDYKKVFPAIKDPISPNLIFTGYLSDEDYLSLLNSVDIVLDLTHMDDCLLCGAYEAVALEKPLVLTDSIALRSYFYRGAVYTKNKSSDIKITLMTAIENLEVLSSEIKILKRELIEKWIDRRNVLLGCLKAMVDHL